MILCAKCDHGNAQMFLEEMAEGWICKRVCVKEWLTGQLLTMDDPGQSTECDCFTTDPYPAAEWPGMNNSNRRFFYYRAIAKLLGATGKMNRAKLPACVYAKIEELHRSCTLARPATRLRSATSAHGRSEGVNDLFTAGPQGCAGAPRRCTRPLRTC